mgnify:CR=1 FL=1
MGNLYFESVELFQSSFGMNAEKIRIDVPNYTNTEPVIQISEVMIFNSENKDEQSPITTKNTQHLLKHPYHLIRIGMNDPTRN